MKQPETIMSEVLNEYQPIAEKRAPGIIRELERLIETRKYEFYLYRRIRINGELEIPNTEELTEEEETIQRSFIQLEVDKKLREYGWKIMSDEKGYYLAKA